MAQSLETLTIIVAVCGGIVAFIYFINWILKP